MVGVFGRWTPTVRGGVVWGRAVAVVALVGAVTLAGATAAHADPPWGSPFTPQDGVCTSTLSDADCWHYARTYQTANDCRTVGLAVTYGYAGSIQCLGSGRAGNTDLWIWRSEGQCPAAGVNADRCTGGLKILESSYWSLPAPVDD